MFQVLAQDDANVMLPELQGVRVAAFVDDGVATVDEETAGAVAIASRALTKAGLVVVEARPPHIEFGHDLWLKLFSRASVVQLRKVYAGREAEAGSFVSWRLANADKTPPAPLDEYIAFWMERDRLRAQLLTWLETTPLIVAPVGATPAYEHDTLKVTVVRQSMNVFRAFSYSQTFNVFDLPVVTIPVAMSNNGLPIGVQIIGRPFAEELILAAAAIVEEAVGGWRQPAVLGDDA